MVSGNESAPKSSEFSPGVVRERIGEHPDIAPLLYTVFSEDSMKIAQTLAEQPDSDITLHFPSRGQLEPVVKHFKDIKTRVTQFLDTQKGVVLLEPLIKDGIEVKELQTSDEASRELAKTMLIDAIPCNQGQSLDDVQVGLEVWAGTTVAIRFDTSDEGIEAYKKVLGITFHNPDGTEITDPQVIKSRVLRYPGFTVERDNFSNEFRKQFQGDVVVMLGDNAKVRQHETQEVIQHFADYQAEQFLVGKDSSFAFPLHNLTPKKVSELLLSDDETVYQTYGKSKEVLINEIEALTPSQIAWSIARGKLAHFCADISLENSPQMQGVLQNQDVHFYQDRTFRTDGMSLELAKKLGQGYEEATLLMKYIKEAAIQHIEYGKEPKRVASLIRAYTINPAEFLAHQAKDAYQEYIKQRESVQNRWDAVTTLVQVEEIFEAIRPQEGLGTIDIETKVEGRFIHDEGTLRVGEVIKTPMLSNELIVLGPLGQAQQGGMSGAYFAVSCREISGNNPDLKEYEVINKQGKMTGLKVIAPIHRQPYVVDSTGKQFALSELNTLPDVNKYFVKEATTESRGGDRLIHLATGGYYDSREYRQMQLEGVDDLFSQFSEPVQSQFISRRNAQLEALIRTIRSDFKDHLTDSSQGKKTIGQLIQETEQDASKALVLGQLSASHKIETFRKLRELHSTLMKGVSDYTNEKIVPPVQRVAHRFQREVLNAATFSNRKGLGLATFIVPLRDMSIFSDPTIPQTEPSAHRMFLVSDYIPGAQDANTLLMNGRKFTQRDVLTIARCMTTALEAIEQNDIVHRDVKPANILVVLNPDGSVATAYLTDFGIANTVGTETIDVDTMAGKSAYSGTEAFGSKDFAAPEQRDARLATTMDIHGLGATLYALVTDESVFYKSGPDREAALIATLTKNNIDPLFAGLIASMVRLDPKDRPQSFGIIEKALHQLENSHLMVDVDPNYTVEEFQKLQSVDEIREFFREAFIPPNLDRVKMFSSLAKLFADNQHNDIFPGSLANLREALMQALRNDYRPDLDYSNFKLSVTNSSHSLLPGEFSALRWYVHLYDKLVTLAQAGKLGTFQGVQKPVTDALSNLLGKSFLYTSIEDKAFLSQAELLTYGSPYAVTKYISRNDISLDDLSSALKNIQESQDDLNKPSIFPPTKSKLEEIMNTNRGLIVAEMYERIKAQNMQRDGSLPFRIVIDPKVESSWNELIPDANHTKWPIDYSIDAIAKQIASSSIRNNDKEALYRQWKPLIEARIWISGHREDFSGYPFSIAGAKYEERVNEIVKSYDTVFSWIHRIAKMVNPYQKEDGSLNIFTIEAAKQFHRNFSQARRTFLDTWEQELSKRKSKFLRAYSLSKDKEIVDVLTLKNVIGENIEDLFKI
ncbi:protein kinase [Candidatus Roizmanbacteria bacterium]|nr:protein kinase [Candidatus Roizmanbacteria bacterium]